MALSTVIQSALYSECHYAEYRYAECPYFTLAWVTMVKKSFMPMTRGGFRFRFRLRLFRPPCRSRWRSLCSALRPPVQHHPALRIHVQATTAVPGTSCPRLLWSGVRNLQKVNAICMTLWVMWPNVDIAVRLPLTWSFCEWNDAKVLYNFIDCWTISIKSGEKIEYELKLPLMEQHTVNNCLDTIIYSYLETPVACIINQLWL